MKFLDLFKSRKFWAALIGLILIMLKPLYPDFPLEADAIVDPIVNIIAVAVVIGSYIIGVAVEDAGRAQK